MPMKRPKAEKLPKPFRDIEHEHDEADRFRIMRMQRELDLIDGVSWNEQTPGLLGRFNRLPRYKIWATLPALAMGAVIIGSFFVAADTGFVRTPRIIWVDSWAASRTAEDAIADREAALATLQADITRTLEVVEPRADSDPEAATHAAALRRYAAMAEQEAAQRARELEERAASEADAARARGLEAERRAAQAATPGS